MVCQYVRLYVWYGGPQKKNKHLEDSLPMSKIVGDSNCKRSATRPRQLHPHGEDHLPLAWWEKNTNKMPICPKSSHQSFKQTKPVQSSATQTNATVKFAIAAMPTSLQNNLWYWIIMIIMKTTANHRRKIEKRIGHIPPEKDKSSVVGHEGGQNSTCCHQKGEKGYRPDHISWVSVH